MQKTQPIFVDRADAGRKLAHKLTHYATHDGVLVLALPRGGVPVGFEVARVLNAPLDIFLVRKLGVPIVPELAMGAIASGGVRVLNRSVIAEHGISDATIARVAAVELQELERREKVYRRNRPKLKLTGKTIILVDDGLATGATMRAAVQGVKGYEAAQIVVAVPVGSAEICAQFTELVDEVVCVEMPYPFRGVGRWYADFRQTTDHEVRQLLDTSPN